MDINANSMLTKTAEVLNKDLFLKHKLSTDWDKLKTDLERLYPAQLELLLCLARNMKKVNIEDKKQAILTRNR